MKNIHLALQVLAREKTQAMVKSAVGSRQIGQWVGEALNQQLSEAFNAQLEKERDEFLGSQPYERQEEPRSVMVSNRFSCLVSWAGWN